MKKGITKEEKQSRILYVDLHPCADRTSLKIGMDKFILHADHLQAFIQR